MTDPAQLYDPTYPATQGRVSSAQLRDNFAALRANFLTTDTSNFPEAVEGQQRINATNANQPVIEYFLNGQFVSLAALLGLAGPTNLSTFVYNSQSVIPVNHKLGRQPFIMVIDSATGQELRQVPSLYQPLGRQHLSVLDFENKAFSNSNVYEHIQQVQYDDFDIRITKVAASVAREVTFSTTPTALSLQLQDALSNDLSGSLIFKDDGSTVPIGAQRSLATNILVNASDPIYIAAKVTEKIYSRTGVMNIWCELSRGMIPGECLITRIDNDNLTVTLPTAGTGTIIAL